MHKNNNNKKTLEKWIFFCCLFLFFFLIQLPWEAVMTLRIVIGAPLSASCICLDTSSAFLDMYSLKQQQQQQQQKVVTIIEEQT